VRPLIQLLKLIAQLVVLFDQPGQLGLNKVDEGADFVLVIARLADRWLTERDIAHARRGQGYRNTPHTLLTGQSAWTTELLEEPGGGSGSQKRPLVSG
jgi:hypothetical protein